MSTLLASPADTSSKPLTWLALLVSLVALNGSLYLSLGLGLLDCWLCVCQRVFLMGVVAVLGVGLVGGIYRPGSLSLLAMPLALAGTLVAGLHIYVEKVGMMPAWAGIWELGTAADQSGVAHAVLLVLVLADLFRGRPPFFATVLGVFLGVMLAYFAVKTAPPLPGGGTEVGELRSN